ncbi:glycosyltransferase family 2 protein [Stakelama saccharophila]|uniref:Glycosyltransferase family A protein n=1 Tax=Stakelama saccharophila TaxID=3075605 RepID=A0ABZ0BBT1_9SPHN|nr:glycosyltransferase family A protein [Stakelama sp. W311]WNO54520.1 glycosyltransferase family A protein [Stakelama sp. W311]
MMKEIRVAVAIPVHNKERHIARTLDSVLAQSRTPDEILVVDDCSSDGSMVVVGSYADPRIRTFRREEPGPGGYAARNLAIEASDCDWIAFLDADDSWRPDHLEGLTQALARAAQDGHAPVSAFSGYRFVSGDRAVPDWYSAAHTGPRTLSTEDLLSAWLSGGCPFWTGAVMIRRDSLLRTGMFPAGLCRRGGDRDLWLRTMLDGPSAFSGRASADYHQDADNMLTRVETFSTRQRVLTTLENRIPRATGRRRTLLEAIFNREVFKYAQRAWAAGQPVTPAMLGGFRPARSPLKFVKIQAMRLLPLPRDAARRGKLKGTLRRIRPGARARRRAAVDRMHGRPGA